MDTDPDKAYYGYDHVAKAQEQLAVNSLLVTDELFRASDVPDQSGFKVIAANVFLRVTKTGGTTKYVCIKDHSFCLVYVSHTPSTVVTTWANYGT